VRNLSIKLYFIYACYTNITLNDIIYIYIKCWVLSAVLLTAVDLGTYYPRIWRSTCTYIMISKSSCFSTATMVMRTRLTINIFDTEFHVVTSRTTTSRNYIKLKYEDIIRADYFLKVFMSSARHYGVIN